VLDRVHAQILQKRTAAWDELAALRERVRAERGDEAAGALAFKTGGGGLMDVDFLAGGGLLERGTLTFPEFPSVPAMLRACASGPKVRVLLEDYRFLRVVEARARWVAGRGVEAFAPDRAGTLIAELVEPGLTRDALIQRLGEARQRTRALYEAVIEAGSLSALDASA
jgi:glutamine synthetase adenylyltransferase